MDSIKKFCKFEITNENKKFLFFNIHILEGEPTSINWLIVMDEMKESFDLLRNSNKKFVIYIDARKINNVPISKIKNVTDLLKVEDEIIENNLICSLIHTESLTFVEQFFKLVFSFYKTKKPLKFIKSKDDIMDFVNESM